MGYGRGPAAGRRRADQVEASPLYQSLRHAPQAPEIAECARLGPHRRNCRRGAGEAAMNVRVADLADAAERRRIDDYVSAHPGAELYHRPQWSIAVEQGCRQRGHYLIAENRTGLAGCLPLVEIRSPLFGNALVSVGFGTGGGPIADDPATAAALVDAGWDLAGDRGCRSMELRGGAIPEGWTAQSGVYVDFTKALPQGDEAILRAMKRRHR